MLPLYLRAPVTVDVDEKTRREKALLYALVDKITSRALDMARSTAASQVRMDPSKRGESVVLLEDELSSRVIGQPQAVDCMVRAFQTLAAGLNPINRPIAVMMFAGATGVGKTRLVEATAEVTLGSPQAVTKIDCAEFQHSHEISKLIGSPAGYLGHRETPPFLMQKTLDRFQTPAYQINFILFDEIEKASDALWNLLLGILDKGILTLGDGGKTDFQKSIITMTTNLGAKEMDKLLGGKSIGFTPCSTGDGKIEGVAIKAIQHRFTPEFINRIDSTVVFNQLEHKHYVVIADLEMQAVQRRILAANTVPFVLRWSKSAIEFLLEDGIDARFGARGLKRTIERHVVVPLSNLIATGQIHSGDTVTVNLDGDILGFFNQAVSVVAK